MFDTIKKPLRGPVRRAKRGWLMYSEFLRDYRRYRDSAAPVDDAVTPVVSGVNLEAQLTKDYHRVEKGLSLRRPKQPFGAAVEHRLSMLIPVAGAQQADAAYLRFAEDAKGALLTWNDGGAVDDDVSPPALPAPLFGAVELDRFFATRHSVRDFDETRPVEPATIEEAVRLATYTPSVCNRQAGRVHAFSGAEDAARILAHQNGNGGFRDQVRSVLVVTVERGLFAGAAERNQRWIDGGLFAMTLVWALHGLGVSSCMLNWSMTNDRTDALRQAAGIPDSEDVICMIAIGYPPEAGFRVARSPRRPVSQVLTTHE
ncbi:nitroreductase [Agromyces sp. 3263]|uniref:nitroreductase family protein n=1 Tax=Agromyces sp. 3263 TaxID=2817750 RepID=UPI00285B33A8|nr:nitroreductase family protein [Agromyces sp. 3263]MDR6904791.1 nitroreductase [Agromyces sp. 3263]